MRKRSKYRPRIAEASPLVIATTRAAPLTTAEITRLTRGIYEAVEKARTGHMTEGGWYRLCTALNEGQAIEAGGVVRGLSERLDAAHDVLDAIAQRAETTGKWVPPTLWANELECLRELADLYKFQLGQLSYGEYRAARDLAVARVKSAKGQVVNTTGME